MKNSAAILLCGGSGTRMKGSVKDKVLEKILLQKTVLEYSIDAFVESKISTICIVCKDDEQKEEILSITKKYKEQNFLFAFGGKERQDSVLNGLNALPDNIKYAFIHDSARPLITAEKILELSEACKLTGASVLGAKVVDTIKMLPEKNSSSETAQALIDLERARLYSMQTPQVFEKNLILKAYEKINSNSISVTDDVAAAVEYGAKVKIVQNDEPNIKITSPSDIKLVEFLLLNK